MGNTVPAGLGSVPLAPMLAGAPLKASAVAPIGEVNNSIVARIGTGSPRIAQAWPRLGSSAGSEAHLFAYAPASLATVCEWRIPGTRGAVEVECYIYGMSTGGGGVCKLVSVTGAADTGNITLGAVAALHGPYTLAVDTSGGYDTVRLRCDATGGTVYIDSVLIRVPALSSPLDPGDLGDGMVAVDTGELAEGESLSADLGRIVRANLSAAREVPHVYVQWSGCRGFTPSATIEYENMRNVPHLWPVLRLPDVSRDSTELTVHACLKGRDGTTNFRLLVGSSHLPGYLARLDIEVAHGAAEAWYTGTIRIPSARVLRQLGPGFGAVGSVFLVVWPMDADAAARMGRYEGVSDDDVTTCHVRGLSVWGV